MAPLACIYEPGYSVIGAGIKDTIPHEQFNMVDVDADTDDPNLKEDKGQTVCCRCCISNKFSAITSSRMNAIVIGYFTAAAIISVVVISTILGNILPSNLAKNKALFDIGNFIFLLTAIFAHLKLPETIDPKEREKGTSMCGPENFRDEETGKKRCCHKEWVSPLTALQRLFGKEQMPQIRVYAAMTVLGGLLGKFGSTVTL